MIGYTSLDCPFSLTPLLPKQTAFNIFSYFSANAVILFWAVHASCVKLNWQLSRVGQFKSMRFKSDLNCDLNDFFVKKSCDLNHTYFRIFSFILCYKVAKVMKL